MSRGGLPLAGLLALLAFGAAAGCTEEGLTGVDGVEPPGQAAEARSVTIPVDRLPLWRDTSYTGFATVPDAPFLLLADQPPLRSRALFSLTDVPDSVGGQPVDSAANMSVRLVADPERSSFTGDSVTLRVYSLDQPFTLGEVTWERAADGRPWSTPGGDLDELLADRRLGAAEADSLIGDTLSVAVDRDADSLVAAWSEAGSAPPLALVLEGEGSRLAVGQVFLELDARRADMDSLLRVGTGTDTATFIHDPDLPAVGERLRVGGLPSSRFYFVFRPPDSVQDVALRGAHVNRAELVFHPVSEPDGAFRPVSSLTSLAIRLLADPFRYGPRTPVGDAVGERRALTLDPDSLSAGGPLRVRVDDLIQAWAASPEDSIDGFRVAVRPVPDGQDLGFWDFGSAGAADGLRPELRLLITPPTDFELP